MTSLDVVIQFKQYAPPWIGSIYGQSILFGDSVLPTAITGGLVLQRTTQDDYIRFRLPDTLCPVLPQPSVPVDSGEQDVAEPNRWDMLVQEPNLLDTTDRWKCTLHSSQSQGDFIGLGYEVYAGDFQVEAEIDAVSYSGGQTGAFFAGVGLLITSGASSAFVGIGFGPGNNRMGGYVSVSGTKGITPSYLGVQPLKLQIQRVGSSVSCRFWNSSDGWTSWTALGTISGTLQLKVHGRRFNMAPTGTDSRTINCRVHYISTLSDIGQVEAVTPIIEVAEPVLEISVRHTAIPYYYRYGATPQACQSAAWIPGGTDLPADYYPYWQVRCAWTDRTLLLDRIVLTTGGVRKFYLHVAQWRLLQYVPPSQPFMPKERYVGGSPSTRLKDGKLHWSPDVAQGFVTTEDD